MFPSSGLKVGRVMGIDIVINVSWLVIFLLVGFSLGDTFRVVRLPFMPSYTNGAQFPGGPWPWIIGFVTAFFFFASLLLHELSHSYIARRNGIHVRRITLFIFGGVAEMSEDVDTAGTELKMAAAGPLMTFLLAGVFALLFWVATLLHAGLVLLYPLLTLAEINLWVGAFNLLPGFPLDGGRVFRSLVWMRTGDMKKATFYASTAGRVIGVGISLVGVYFFIIGAYVGGFWFVVIGFFLYRLAQIGYQQTMFRLAAVDTTVGDIMYTDVPVVDSGTSLTSLRNHYFSAYRLPGFPVRHDGIVDSIIDVNDLGGIAPSEWDILDAGRVAHPMKPEQKVSPDTPLEKVMKLVMGGEDFLVVMKDEDVVGMLTREELMRYVNMRVKLQASRRRGGPEA